MIFTVVDNTQIIKRRTTIRGKLQAKLTEFVNMNVPAVQITVGGDRIQRRKIAE